MRAEFLEMLSEIIQDKNKSVLLSTHVTSDLEKIADYVIFIRDGKIQFSSTKGKIMESYRLVKGPTSELTTEMIKKSINYRETSLNFEALFENLKGINIEKGRGIIVEKPTLDDIMIYSVKGSKTCLGLVANESTLQILVRKNEILCNRSTYGYLRVCFSYRLLFLRELYREKSIRLKQSINRGRFFKGSIGSFAYKTTQITPIHRYLSPFEYLFPN